MYTLIHFLSACVYIYTVESIIYLWDPDDYPVWRGVPNSEADLYTALYVFGTADSVLIREVSFIQNALHIEVLLYLVGTVIQLSTAGLTTDCTDNYTHSPVLYVPTTPALHACLWWAAPSHNPMYCTYSEEGGVIEASGRAPNDYPVCSHVIRLFHARDEVLLAQ